MPCMSILDASSSQCGIGDICSLLLQSTTLAALFITQIFITIFILWPMFSWTPSCSEYLMCVRPSVCPICPVCPVHPVRPSHPFVFLVCKQWWHVLFPLAYYVLPTMHVDKNYHYDIYRLLAFKYWSKLTSSVLTMWKMCTFAFIITLTLALTLTYI